MRKMLILLALVVVTTANAGCCGRFRNWLHRGSPCGTRTIAPAMIGAPLAIGSPFVPQAATQIVVPQQPQYCCPQEVPCCPQYNTGCCVEEFSGGVVGDCNCGGVTSYDEGYLVPGTETPIDPRTYEEDPGPARENGTR